MIAVIFMEDMRIQYYDSLAESNDSNGGKDDDYNNEGTRPCNERNEKTVQKKERGGSKNNCVSARDTKSGRFRDLNFATYTKNNYVSIRDASSWHS